MENISAVSRTKPTVHGFSDIRHLEKALTRMEGSLVEIPVYQNALCIAKKLSPDSEISIQKKRMTEGKVLGYFPLWGIILDIDSREAVDFCEQLFSNRSTKLAVFWKLMHVKRVRSYIIPYFIKECSLPKAADVIFFSTGNLVRLVKFSNNTVINLVRNTPDSGRIWNMLKFRQPFPESIRTPAVLELNKEKKYYLEEFIPAKKISYRRLTGEKMWEILESSLSSLAVLYSLEKEEWREADQYLQGIFKIIMETYENCWGKDSFYSLLSSLLQRILRSYDATGAKNIRINRIHGDFHLENLLLAKTGEVYLIDWEYTQKASSLHDFCNLASQLYINYNEPLLVDQMFDTNSNSDFRKLLRENFDHLSEDLEYPNHIKTQFLIYFLEMILFRILDNRYRNNKRDFQWVVSRISKLYGYMRKDG